MPSCFSSIPDYENDATNYFLCRCRAELDARAGDAVAGLFRPATVLGEEEEDRQIARPREDTEEETEAE